LNNTGERWMPCPKGQETTAIPQDAEKPVPGQQPLRESKSPKGENRQRIGQQEKTLDNRWIETSERCCLTGGWELAQNALPGVAHTQLTDFTKTATFAAGTARRAANRGVHTNRR
jgi:hypothetical protein